MALTFQSEQNKRAYLRLYSKPMRFGVLSPEPQFLALTRSSFQVVFV
ncbi:MAG TPA: hypothetical protein V6C65_31175 [Allocoleopsis sp.]